MQIRIRSTKDFMSNNTVLITGGSSGIGFQLARQFAKHGHPLILAARHEGKLKEAARSLAEEFGVPVRSIAQNLEEPEAAQKIYDAVMSDGTGIGILVNDAGFGERGKFWEIPVERNVAMIRVNIEALVRLTGLFLPGFLKRGHGRVLNVASTAAYQPGPLLATYYASKAFVLSLSEALFEELKETGVTVTALCPGATDTEFFTEAGMENATIVQKGNLMAPQDVAEGGYKALMDGERVYVAGGLNKAMAFSTRLLSDGLQSKLAEKLHSDVGPGEVKRVSGEVAAKAAAKGK
jgi:short-subunit dehydrogenase